MKQILRHQNSYLLRFDKGEDVMQELKNFCEEESVKAGSFTGIGATDELTISIYDLEKNSYQDRELRGQKEVISFVGNISKFKDQTIVHAHGCFADETMQIIAGHVKKMVISVTCELSLQVFPEKIERKIVEGTELKLLC